MSPAIRTTVRLFAIARDWGRTDAERRHRAGLMMALSRLGVEAELVVLSNSGFSSGELDSWASVTAHEFSLDEPGSLVAQTAAIRALLTARRCDLIWGLDEEGNRCARVAQAIDRKMPRVVTGGLGGGGAGGLTGRLRSLMSSHADLTIVRTGAPPPRKGLLVPPGVQAGELRRHAPDVLVRRLRRVRGVAADRRLIAACAETEAGRAMLAETDAALRSAGPAPQWLWLGPEDAPAGPEWLDGAAGEVAGDLPLLACADAAVATDGGGLSRLFWREAVGLSRPTLAPTGSADLENGIGLHALPQSAAELAGRLHALWSEPAIDPAVPYRHALDRWSVRQEAEQLAEAFLPRPN